MSDAGTLLQEIQHYPIFYYATIWVQNFDFYQINWFICLQTEAAEEGRITLIRLEAVFKDYI
jgi:hypothetical protein